MRMSIILSWGFLGILILEPGSRLLFNIGLSNYQTYSIMASTYGQSTLYNQGI